MTIEEFIKSIKMLGIKYIEVNDVYKSDNYDQSGLYLVAQKTVDKKSEKENISYFLIVYLRSQSYVANIYQLYNPDNNSEFLDHIYNDLVKISSQFGVSAIDYDNLQTKYNKIKEELEAVKNHNEQLIEGIKKLEHELLNKEKAISKLTKDIENKEKDSKINESLFLKTIAVMKNEQIIKEII